jgi:hypothetical protein
MKLLKKFCVTPINPLNKNILNEDYFLPSCIGDKPYSKVTPSDSQPSEENTVIANEGGAST